MFNIQSLRERELAYLICFDMKKKNSEWRYFSSDWNLFPKTTYCTFNIWLSDTADIVSVSGCKEATTIMIRHMNFFDDRPDEPEMTSVTELT